MSEVMRITAQVWEGVKVTGILLGILVAGAAGLLVVGCGPGFLAIITGSGWWFLGYTPHLLWVLYDVGGPAK